MSRATFFHKLELGDISINLGNVALRDPLPGQTEEPPPDWSMLCRAKIWTADEHAEKRKFLRSTRVKVQAVKTSEADVITLMMTGGDKDAERGTISVYDARQATLPSAVRTSGFAFGIAPAAPSGTEFNPILRHLMENDVAVMLYGKSTAIRSSQQMIQRDYPHYTTHSVIWFTVPKRPKSTLAVGRNAYLNERAVLVACSTTELAERVCNVGIGHPRDYFLF